MYRQLTLIGCCLLVLCGCAGEQSAAERAGRSIQLGDVFDEAALVLGTSRLLSEAHGDLIGVSSEAVRSTTRPHVREDSLRWRISTISKLDSIRALEDPRLRFAALWTLATELRLDMVAGRNKERFEDVQGLYAEAARSLEEKVIALAYEAFPDATIDRVRPEIERVAATRGITAWFGPQRETGRSELGALLSVPLSPISGLQGVGDTPSAINRFTDKAGEIGHIVENLPERTRWQIELLLLDAENDGVVAAALEEVRKTREQLAEITATVGAVPGQFRDVVKDVNEVQPALAENLERVNVALKQADQTSRAVAETVQGVRSGFGELATSAAAVQAAATELRLLAAEFKREDDAPEPAKQGEELNVRDVEAAATQIRTAAAEVRGLLADLQQPVALPTLDRSIADARQLIWLATYCAAGLLVLAFLLALLYRLVAPRRA